MLESIRESALFIAQNSQHVCISPVGIQRSVKFLVDHLSSNAGRQYSVDRICESWHKHRLHPSQQSEDCSNHLLLMDLLNFSFYSDDNNNDGAMYTVTFNGEKYSGYWTLCACLMRAKEEGIAITDATYWASISQAEGERIFRGDHSESIMPLLSTRVQLIREAGQTLLQEFNGDFSECIRRSGKSADRLVELLGTYFSSFRDTATFKGRPVHFYKRAQILVADIWACYGGRQLGEFHDIDQITMFADYRVPQILVGLGALEYTPSLLQFLRQPSNSNSSKDSSSTSPPFINNTMQSGDERECEIRGNSIHAVELIVKELRQSLAGTDRSANAITVDFFLWDYAKQHADELKDIPIHRVRSYFY